MHPTISPRHRPHRYVTMPPPPKSTCSLPSNDTSSFHLVVGTGSCHRRQGVPLRSMLSLCYVDLLALLLCRAFIFTLFPLSLHCAVTPQPLPCFPSPYISLVPFPLPALLLTSFVIVFPTRFQSLSCVALYRLPISVTRLTPLLLVSA